MLQFRALLHVDKYWCRVACVKAYIMLAGSPTLNSSA